MATDLDTANFIWQVADDILRGAFKPHEYGDVILPFVVLRRLDLNFNAYINGFSKNVRGIIENLEIDVKSRQSCKSCKSKFTQ